MVGQQSVLNHERQDRPGAPPTRPARDAPPLPIQAISDQISRRGNGRASGDLAAGSAVGVLRVGRYPASVPTLTQRPPPGAVAVVALLVGVDRGAKVELGSAGLGRGGRVVDPHFAGHHAPGRERRSLSRQREGHGGGDHGRHTAEAK